MEEESVVWIVWSDRERAYVTNLGHSWKKYNHIPEEYRHLVKLLKPTPTRHPTRSLHHPLAHPQGPFG